MPEAKYDEIAQWYDEGVRQGILGLYDLVLPVVYALMGEVSGIDVCDLALMDIPDVAATFRSVGRILRSGGIFIFSLTHPCLLPPGSRLLYDTDGVQGRFVRGYFQEIFWRSDNIRGVRGKVGAYHRTLSTYLNTLIEAGLTLERLAEPQATGEMADRLPGYIEVPGILIVKSRK